jgi:negative regulator of flagellin synthesis FlgM
MSIERLGSLDPLSAYNKAQKTNRVPARDGDSISVSEEARHKAELLRLSEHVRNSPDVREDRVAEVKRKLENNEYNNDETIAALADKIIDSFGL